MTKAFVGRGLHHVITDDRVRGEILQRTAGRLESCKENAEAELQRIIDDEKFQPITYNHYYTDNIQKARQGSLKTVINDAMKSVASEDRNGKFHVSNIQVDFDKLLSSLQNRVVVDMDDQACSEAQAGLTAYYKVCSAHKRIALFAQTLYHQCRSPGRHLLMTYAVKSSSGISCATSPTSFLHPPS